MICQKSTFSWYILVVFIGQLTSPVVMVLWWPVVLLQGTMARWMTDITTRVFWTPNKAYTGRLSFFQSFLIYVIFLMVMRNIFYMFGKVGH